MKLALTGHFLCVLYGLTAGIVKVHIYETTPMNWSYALLYCRESYKDLSTFNTEQGLMVLEETDGTGYNHSWIGLYRGSENFELLKCDENISDEDLSPSEIQWPSECMYAYKGHWQNQSCLNQLPFFCYENLILVQENKTWEEALEYCRSHYTDLAYLGTEGRLNQIKNETKNTQTESVWTGLRFLAGDWFWVNMKYIETNIDLPLCPSEPYRCGAHNTITEQWENRDCEEKLNFLCYWI